ncbi:MAG: hypothetical protein K1X50_11525, partial [Candidatus Promineofilum sp.]|nr:hypothetical protein [Promineifilum sp.]
LGTLGGVVLWAVLGLIMGGTTARTQRAVDPFHRWSLPVIAVAGLMLLAVLIVAARPVNRAGQLAGGVLLNTTHSAAQAAAAAEPLTAARCRAGWYEGLLLHEAGDIARRSAVWGDLLACAADYTGYMAVLAHDDAALAQQALTVQPDNPAAYFWLASLSAPDKPDEAVALYRQGLALAPGDGRRWLALAELLDGRDEDGALDAYLQACLHGDPGANGCARAAAIVAARGDLETAIRYYRLSNWSEAQAMADELERQIDP